MFVVGGAINYYADQKTQIVLFVVQFALFGLLANRVHRRLAAVHDRVRRLLGRGLDQPTGRSELRVEMEIGLYRDRSSLREGAEDFWAAACASAA